MPRYLGGTRRFFLLTLYNFKNNGGGGEGARAPRPPLLRGPWTWNFHFAYMADSVFSSYLFLLALSFGIRVQLHCKICN